eukprot:TRINITY_DN29016_c0_g1_i1.p1 TRINITY_DN29016_c0_g1~~TRINITY_DN29016_c0_g1_i1.p1  ORF type:complete len:179 (+),score=23.77 TRINITY_DN29016_c0_g1_i1:81-617(+)
MRFVSESSNKHVDMCDDMGRSAIITTQCGSPDRLVPTSAEASERLARSTGMPSASPMASCPTMPRSSSMFSPSQNRACGRQEAWPPCGELRGDEKPVISTLRRWALMIPGNLKLECVADSSDDEELAITPLPGIDPLSGGVAIAGRDFIYPQKSSKTRGKARKHIGTLMIPKSTTDFL